jgi:anti-sigma28 factor (negative regulator of flagellin synthesis)
MNKEELKLLQEKYNGIIIEKTIEDIKKMCDQGELDINAPASSIWVVNYSGEEPAIQADMLLNQLIDTGISTLIVINHEDMFKKVYAVKDYKGQQDIIAILKDSIDVAKFDELYSETADMFSLSNYLNEQLQLNGTYVKEEYDPLNFNGRQAEVDAIEEKYNNGEITLGEMFQEFGWIKEGEFDKDKIAEIVEKLVSGELNTKDIVDKLNNQELNSVEINTIQDILKKKYPDVYDKLNQEI